MNFALFSIVFKPIFIITLLLVIINPELFQKSCFTSCQAFFNPLELNVSTMTTSLQFGLSFALIKDGNAFVAVWESQTTSSTRDILGRIYNIDGSQISQEFVINGYTLHDQTAPSVCAINNQTQFVVSWSSILQDGSGLGIYFKIFDSSGKNQTNDIRANEYTSSDQKNSIVTSLDYEGRRFAIIWISSEQDGNLDGVFMRIFDKTGQNLTREFRVNNYTTNNQNNFVFCTLENETKLAIAWTSNGQDSSEYGVYFRLFYSNGTQVCNEQQANQYTHLTQQNPNIHPIGNKSIFFLAWNSFNQLGSLQAQEVYGRIFDSNCISLTNETRINNHTLSQQIIPKVIRLGLESFGVFWQSYNQTGSDFDIFGRILSVNGSYITGEFPVNNYINGIQIDQIVASLNNGQFFVVTWDGRLSYSSWNRTIYSKIFYSNGTVFANDILINNISSQDRNLPSILSRSIDSWHIIGFPINVTNSFSFRARIFRPCLTIEDCCDTLSCTPEYFPCSLASCRDLEGQLVPNRTEIFSTQALSLNIILTKSYPSIPINFNISCSCVESNLTVSTPYPCDDPDLLFDQLMNNTALEIPGYYFQNVITTSVYSFTILMSTVYKNYSAFTIVTVHNRTAYLNSLCLTIQKPACLDFLANCSLPEYCTSQLSSCPYCINDTHCSGLFCVNQLCENNLITSQLTISRNIVYIDQDFYLTSFYTNNVQSLPVTIVWNCSYLNSNNPETCSDPDLIFSSSSPSLLIPKFYFFNLVSYQSLFQLSVKISTIYNSSVSLINVTISKRLNLTIQPYPYYTPYQEFFFIVLESNTSENQYTYEWQLNPYINFYQLTSTSDQIKLLKSEKDFPMSTTHLFIIINGTSLSNKISDIFKIPINQPPADGSLMIEPPSGISLITSYQFTAENWQDIDLPLSYRFSFSSNSSEGFVPFFSNFEMKEAYSSILPGSAITNTSFIKLEIMDNFGAISSAFNTTICQMPYKDLRTAVNLVGDILNSLNNSTNLTNSQKTSTLNIISNQIVNLETLYQNGSDTTQSRIDACPACSGHGTCLNSKCSCFEGWSFYDCSINKTEYDNIIATKVKILDSVALLLENPENRNDSKLTSTIKLVTTNPDFNNVDTFTKVQTILESNLKIGESNITLTKAQAEDVSKIVDSTFKFLSTYDCSASTNLSENTANKSSLYMDTITRSLAADSSIYSNASVYNQDTYSLYTKKISICDLSQLSLSTGSNLSPVVNISLDTSIYTNCSKIVTVQYIALDSNLMSCNISSPKFFSVIGLKFYYEQGKELVINPKVTLVFSDPSFVSCNSACIKQVLTCICPNLNMFDFQNQIQNLFGNSQLKNIFKFDALGNLEFLKTVPFWMMVSYLIFTIALVARVSRIERYDGVKDYLIGDVKSKLRKFFLTYSVINFFFLTLGFTITLAGDICKRKNTKNC